MMGIGDWTTSWISPLQSTNTGVEEYGGANADRPSRTSLGGPCRQADWIGAGRSFLVSFFALTVSSGVGFSVEAVSPLGSPAGISISTDFSSSLSSQSSAKCDSSDLLDERAVLPIRAEPFGKISTFDSYVISVVRSDRMLDSLLNLVFDLPAGPLPPPLM